MRTAALLPAFAALAVAGPVALEARQDASLCPAEPVGYGPIPVPDTAEAFLASTEIANFAINAVTPAGYVQTYSNLQAAAQAFSYQGVTNLKTYNPATCAAICDKKAKCHGFNIVFERDPSVTPDSVNCPNPASTTIIKCVYWGGYVATENAKNKGGFRIKFHVVTAGSNGYMKTSVPTVDGFTGASYGNAAINAPVKDLNGKNTLIRGIALSSTWFDPSACATVCNNNNVYELAHSAKPKLCKFFVTYLQATSGVPTGQYCAIYAAGWDQSWATNTGDGKKLTIGYSFAYWNTTNPGFPTNGAQF